MNNVKYEGTMAAPGDEVLVLQVDRLNSLEYIDTPEMLSVFSPEDYRVMRKDELVLLSLVYNNLPWLTKNQIKVYCMQHKINCFIGTHRGKVARFLHASSAKQLLDKYRLHKHTTRPNVKVKNAGVQAAGAEVLFAALPDPVVMVGLVDIMAKPIREGLFDETP